ncbi:MAG TPA: response regulator [Candidatus Binatia bacterium]|jgi:CheY-like chemotaxis protein|nr:response regulator [Candidatus Binatia bacterium]
MEQKIVRGKRVLLVDDEASVRGAFRMMLEVDDHQVTEAANGAEALDLFTKGEFDLVTTDFEMPIMKGNELAMRIKSAAPKQPVLMITAYGREVGGSQNQADAIMNKPFIMNDLRQAIAKLL